MPYTRRQLLKLGLGVTPLTCLLRQRTSLFAAVPAGTKPNSKFNGVQIGVIAPYSFRGLPGTAEGLLGNLVELEYSTPPGSTVMAELAKCAQFCKGALA